MVPGGGSHSWASSNEQKNRKGDVKRGSMGFLLSMAHRFLLVLLTVLLPLPSQAFVVATDGRGQMLRWPDPGELRFVIHAPQGDHDSLPPTEELVTAVSRAADSWSDIEGSLVFIETEVAPSGAIPPRPGYNRDDPSGNTNAILFETERWRHQPGAFAVTLRAYGSQTGNLLHADIVINAVQYRWAALEQRTRPDPDGDGPVDLQAVLTHELGHALGFEHTTTIPSVMRSTIGFGEICMRELSETDVDGLRFLYPPEMLDEAVAARVDNSVDEEIIALLGCSSAPQGAHVHAGLLSLIVLLGLAFVHSRAGASKSWP